MFVDLEIKVKIKIIRIISEQWKEGEVEIKEEIKMKVEEIEKGVEEDMVEEEERKDIVKNASKEKML